MATSGDSAWSTWRNSCNLLISPKAFVTNSFRVLLVITGLGVQRHCQLRQSTWLLGLQVVNLAGGRELSSLESDSRYLHRQSFHPHCPFHLHCLRCQWCLPVVRKTLRCCCCCCCCCRCCCCCCCCCCRCCCCRCCCSRCCCCWDYSDSG